MLKKQLKTILGILLVSGVALTASNHYPDLKVDNIVMDANTISTSNTNGNLILAPNGTGYTVISPDLRLRGTGLIETINSQSLDVRTEAVAGGSQDIYVYSGDASAGASGAAWFYSGDGQSTGDVDIFSGAASAGNSGDILLGIGTATATRGAIKFQDGSEGTQGEAWVSTGTVGEGGWGVLGPIGGGTGVANNAANTITFSGNYGLTLTLSNTTSVTLPTTGTLATLAGTESLSNKTADDGLDFNEEASLSNPSAGKRRLGVKADGLLYLRDSAGNESQISPSGATHGPTDLKNLALSTSVAASAMTIALKTQAGADPSGGDPVTIAFRSSTATSGIYNDRTVTAALSMAISSGATLGHTDATAGIIYVYALDNSGTVELAVSSALFDNGSILSTTIMNSSSDSATVIYSTTARANVPIRLIGRLSSTQTTAGTYAANATEVSVGVFDTTSNSWVGATTTYTSSDTYTVPFGVSLVSVEVCGGGGGGGAGGSGTGKGGGGGAGVIPVARVFKVTPGQAITITIGAGGTAGTGSGDGGVGGTSSFGSYLSVVGGDKGTGSANSVTSTSSTYFLFNGGLGGSGGAGGDGGRGDGTLGTITGHNGQNGGNGIASGGTGGAFGSVYYGGGGGGGGGLGAGGAGGASNAAGTAAAANSCAGGGGGGGGEGTNRSGGAGGSGSIKVTVLN